MHHLATIQEYDVIEGNTHGSHPPQKKIKTCILQWRPVPPTCACSYLYENVWVWTATNHNTSRDEEPFISWPIHNTSACTFIEAANMSDRPPKVSSCHHRNSCPHGPEPVEKQCGTSAGYNFKKKNISRTETKHHGKIHGIFYGFATHLRLCNN